MWLVKLLLPFAVDLAIRWGIPALVKKFPFLPTDLLNKLVALVEQAIQDLSGYHPTSPEGVAVRSLAKREAKQCIGAFCEAKTKGLD